MMKENYDDYKNLVNEHLLDFIPSIDTKSSSLYESMKYSLTAGGKRLRSVLLLASCEFAGGKANHALPYACAMEYIQTYSLIHDDLPAMDDDDLRRGLPTNHKVFGPGIATLAGDGLLTTAFEIMNRDMLLYFDNQDSLIKRVKASYAIAKGAGVRGMVAGQVSDIESEHKKCSNEMLEYIHLNKTGALIIASVRAGLFLGGADDEMMTRMLQNGAVKVYAIDVGYGQLDWKLRNDSRVVNMEKCNVRYLNTDLISDPIDFISIDVSFISLKLIFPVAVKVLKDTGSLVCLVKPQFEAGREQVGKKGIVRDVKVHDRTEEFHRTSSGSEGESGIRRNFTA